MATELDAARCAWERAFHAHIAAPYEPALRVAERLAWDSYTAALKAVQPEAPRSIP